VYGRSKQELLEALAKQKAHKNKEHTNTLFAAELHEHGLPFDIAVLRNNPPRE
jgi:hypothetical protein